MFKANPEYLNKATNHAQAHHVPGYILEKTIILCLHNYVLCKDNKSPEHQSSIPSETLENDLSY
jgi:hypothetical protein